MFTLTEMTQIFVSILEQEKSEQTAIHVHR